DISPPKIVDLWREAWGHRSTNLRDVPYIRQLWQALVQICVTADDAMCGLGFPLPISARRSRDAFARIVTEFEAQVVLKRQREIAEIRERHPLAAAVPITFCKRISHQKAVVLPKVSTPQNGLTLRSLTHHLALIRGGEVSPVWQRYELGDSLADGVNLLLF